MGYEKKTAVFAGTFDPVTVGHIDIIKRASEIFDEVHVVIAVNPEKKTMFSGNMRLEMIEKAVDKLECRDRVVVALWERPVFEYCRLVGASVIVKGVRGAADFDYEKILAKQTTSFCPDIETLCMFSASEYEHISSTYVRGCIEYGFSLDGIVPAPARELIEKSAE